MKSHFLRFFPTFFWRDTTKNFNEISFWDFRADACFWSSKIWDEILDVSSFICCIEIINIFGLLFHSFFLCCPSYPELFQSFAIHCQSVPMELAAVYVVHAAAVCLLSVFKMVCMCNKSEAYLYYRASYCWLPHSGKDWHRRSRIY